VEGCGVLFLLMGASVKELCDVSIGKWKDRWTGKRFEPRR
jgi:hypothetical protein